MSDDAVATLKALKAASDPPRWLLLKRAVEVGSFPATAAAEIAGLTRRSGNARSTHAEGLRRANVLERVLGVKPVTYAVTERGVLTYRILRRALGEEPARPSRRRVVLHPGDRVAIEAPADPGARLFELSRRS